MNTHLWKTALLAGAIGIFAGWLIWGMKTPERELSGMHRMPDGTMMRNDGSPINLMQGMMHDMNASLEGKSGDAFDKEFLDQMIVHHEGAVAMAQKVLEVSKRPELIKLANDIIKAQTAEIAQMKEWKAAWFN